MAQKNNNSISKKNMKTAISIENVLPKKLPKKKDAVDFYGLYHKDFLSTLINNSSQIKSKSKQTKGKKTPKTVEEPVCFWCKDGGNLITCDCTPNFDPNRFKNLRCPKVYHEVCLGFKVPEDQEVWNCPRHFCKLCADYGKYLCISCPTSFCKKHIYENNDRNQGKKKPLFTPIKAPVWDQKEKYTGKRKYVLCNYCASNENKAFKRGIIEGILPRDNDYKVVEVEDEDRSVLLKNETADGVTNKINLDQLSLDDIVGNEYIIKQRGLFDKRKNKFLVNTIHVVPLGLAAKLKKRKSIGLRGAFLLAIQVNQYGEPEGKRLKIRPATLIPLDKNSREYASASLRRKLCKELLNERDNSNIATKT